MKRRHHEEHVNHERWAIPYGDLITLLLALFGRAALSRLTLGILLLVLAPAGLLLGGHLLCGIGLTAALLHLALLLSQLLGLGFGFGLDPGGLVGGALGSLFQ